MWNGTKDALNGGKLSESNFICMKVTGKVKHHKDTDEDEYFCFMLIRIYKIKLTEKNYYYSNC